MSTRCNITIVDKNINSSILLYKHHDGNPENILKLISEFEAGSIASLNPLGLFLMDNGGEVALDLNSDIEYYYLVTIRDNIHVTVLKPNEKYSKDTDTKNLECIKHGYIPELWFSWGTLRQRTSRARLYNL